MTDRLSLYNGALAAMGERKLANLTENREPRYKLDDIWNRDFIDTVLEQGQWKFATRSVELAYSPSVSPADFGYEFGFQQPSDLVRVTGVGQDEFFKNPLLEYEDEAGYWWADLDLIWVRFVSNLSTYGGDFSLWPKNFTRLAEFWLAEQAAPTIMGRKADMSVIEAGVIKWLKKAKATDAMKSPARFQPPSSWTRARRERRGGDRGSRNRLIG